jgi:hypothetical protein
MLSRAVPSYRVINYADIVPQVAFPRRSYRQIFRPYSHFAKFADDLCRQIDICVTPMATWRP